MEMKKSLNERLFIVYVLLFAFAAISTLSMVIMTVSTVFLSNVEIEYGSWLNFVPFPSMALLFGSLAYMSGLGRFGGEISDERRRVFLFVNIVLTAIIVGSILYLELVVYPSEVNILVK